MKVLGFLFSLVIVFATTSCQHESLDPTKNNPTDTTAQSSGSCSADTVYFTNTILPLLVSNCAMSGCHDSQNPQDGVVLTNYSDIVKHVKAGKPSSSKIYECVMGYEDLMPPYPYNQLTTEQTNLIKKWIEQGALNNTCTEECDTTSNITYSATIAPIISKNCGSCHGNTNPSGGASLTTYEQVRMYGESGQLYGMINHENGYSFMPPTNTKISQCSIDQIKAWIDANYPQ